MAALRLDASYIIFDSRSLLLPSDPTMTVPATYLSVPHSSKIQTHTEPIQFVVELIPSLYLRSYFQPNRRRISYTSLDEACCLQGINPLWCVCLAGLAKNRMRTPSEDV